jgi:putative salt-induced outer membrane protein YdiY
MKWCFRLLAVQTLVLAAAPAAPQTCPCPPAATPGWHGGAGLGLAITGGNSDTQNYSLDFLVTYDPQKRNVVKIDGLYLRAKADGADTANKAALGLRDEYGLGRAFLFGEGRYQRDRFKQLDYLITPIVGAGLKLVDGPRVKAAVDAGIGLAFEKLEARDATTDGALRAGESIAWKISETATLTHLASAVFKMDDFGDAFYHLDTGLAASVSQRLALRIAGVIDVKNKPADPSLKKTDTALLASIAFKF